VTTRWGRLGTNGQSTTKTYPTEAKAQAEHAKLVGEKTKKGYVET
jgi:DNA ligase-1